MALTESNRWMVRQSWIEGATPEALAQMYGCSVGEIEALVKTYQGRFAQHVAPPPGPTTGYRCQVCTRHTYGPVDNSLIEGMFLARCLSCHRTTAHVKVGTPDLSQMRSRVGSGRGQARHTDPVTSKEAAGKVRTEPAQVALLRAHEKYREGLTDEQAARLAGLEMTSEYATRCSELQRAGFLEASGEMEIGVSGMRRIVRRITRAGVERIRSPR